MTDKEAYQLATLLYKYFRLPDSASPRDVDAMEIFTDLLYANSDANYQAQLCAIRDEMGAM